MPKNNRNKNTNVKLSSCLANCWTRLKNEVTKVLMTVKVQSSEQLEQAAEAMETRGESIANVTYTAPSETGEVQTIVDPDTVRGAVGAASDVFARVGRNEPCPCGSGKKFKQCHGKLA
jgi:preprotein translocase subunit SecA